MAIPALLSKKASAPVMMRISREEENYIGRARTSMVGRARVGFAKDGRITALDFFIVQDNGPYGPMGDHRSAGLAASLIYQPEAMRWRAVNVLTNTPPRTQQRSPGADAGQRHHRAGDHEGRQGSWASIRSPSGGSTRRRARPVRSAAPRTDSDGM